VLHLTGLPRLMANTALLTAVSLVMRTIGVSFGVFLINRIGAAALGQYQLVMTVYGLCITLSCSGIRLAATRLVTDALARGQNPRRAVRFCALWGLASGGAVAGLLFFSADFLAGRWLGEEGLALSLRILSLGLPALASASALHGYFTAQRQIARQSLIGLFEQLTQITVSVAALNRLAPMGPAWACAGVALGICCSEFLSLGLSLALYRPQGPARPSAAMGRLARRFVRICSPVALGALLCSGLRTAEQLMVPAGLRRFGMSDTRALSLYGSIHGMVLPILFYPSAILSALSGLLVPELGEHYARGRTKRIGEVVSGALRLTALYAAAVTAMAMGFSREISEVVYRSTGSAALIALFAPLIPLAYLDLVADGMLKGLDQQFRQMLYSALDALLCVSMVWIFIPRWGLYGYLLTIFAAKSANTLLSLHRLIRVAEVRIDLWGAMAKPLFCAAAGVLLARRIPAPPLGAIAALSVKIFICAFFYLTFLWLSGCIGAEKHIPRRCKARV
jgi:O-antigen/teichoic acid export membrane protein